MANFAAWRRWRTCFPWTGTIRTRTSGNGTQDKAVISNNSWNYGDNAYDLAAASYDAAVRDALPEVTGSQPVLFVFSAGNSGNGDDGGANGNADTILSPATAKNVITVGAIEQLAASRTWSPATMAIPIRRLFGGR